MIALPIDKSPQAIREIFHGFSYGIGEHSGILIDLIVNDLIHS